MRQMLRPCVFVALATTLLVRAAIPAGFMPAPIGPDFPLQICPGGLPEDALQRLAGNLQRQHAGGHHGHGNEHGHHAGDDGQHTYSAEQCPIGHLIGAAALPVHTEPSPPRLVGPVPAQVLPRGTVSTRIALPRSRGPPLPSAA